MYISNASRKWGGLLMCIASDIQHHRKLIKPALKPDELAAPGKIIKTCIKRLNALPLYSLEVLYLNSRWRHTTFPKPVQTSSHVIKILTTIPHIVLQLKPPSQFVTHFSNSTCFVNVSAKTG